VNAPRLVLDRLDQPPGEPDGTPAVHLRGHAPRLIPIDYGLAVIVFGDAESLRELVRVFEVEEVDVLLVVAVAELHKPLRDEIRDTGAEEALILLMLLLGTDNAERLDGVFEGRVERHLEKPDVPLCRVGRGHVVLREERVEFLDILELPVLRLKTKIIGVGKQRIREERYHHANKTVSKRACAHSKPLRESLRPIVGKERGGRERESKGAHCGYTHANNNKILADIYRYYMVRVDKTSDKYVEEFAMPIGKGSFFTKSHYESVTGLADPKLTELVVHCLELVAELKNTGFPFRFKGGNSLLLILPHPERFSIDVDIVAESDTKEITRAVEKIIASDTSVFTRYEVRPHKTKPWLPMISFKLFFNSIYQSDEDAYVMLDAVLEKAPYPGEMRLIACGDIFSVDSEVETPSTSGLIADKMLTLGPSTLGIPLGKEKEAQRLKHIFDIASLLRTPYKVSLVREAIMPCIEQENAIQKKKIKFQSIQQDTLLFLAQTKGLNDAIRKQAIGQRQDPIGADSSSPEGLRMAYRREICLGFDDFSAHLFRTRYTWERLEEDAASVAALLETL